MPWLYADSVPRLTPGAGRYLVALTPRDTTLLWAPSKDGTLRAEQWSSPAGRAFILWLVPAETMAQLVREPK